ncbi:glycosyltransferase [Synechococcus sp. CBW1004]|uniref:glycosyltransferase n=1 Tax=Synechococcus sp. CBW1004 TaxID=1353136 RepID=UPI0018CF926F|nr:glycosyltransferase [Synechococcus sp. CBW1004]QPN64324.1 glycosyltransferase [Synechococcus sp. CBW1004]
MKLAIFSPHQKAYSETFIENHIRFLPFEKVVFTGREIPLIKTPNSFCYRLLCWLDKFLSPFYQNNHWIWKTYVPLCLNLAKIDICIFEFGTTAGKFHKFLEKAGIPYVVHFHGFDAHHKPTLELNRQEYISFFRKASALIVVSESMKAQIRSLGAPPSKVKLNHYGVDSSVFIGAAPDSSPPNFIAVGRFVEKKAPHLLILSFNLVVSSIPNARLLMIGDGPLLSACKSLVAALGLRSHISFPGILVPEKIVQHLKKSRAFVHHSINSIEGDSEGLPLSIIEAQMIGLPVVATKHAGIPDIVIHGHTGLLSNELDIHAMATNIILLARDKHFAAEMGINARKNAIEKFSLDTQISKLASILVNSYAEQKASGSE